MPVLTRREVQHILCGLWWPHYICLCKRVAASELGITRGEWRAEVRHLPLLLEEAAALDIVEWHVLANLSAVRLLMLLLLLLLLL